jgi:hypothetical protein
MELWQDAEIRIRRDDALGNAHRSRLLRRAASGRGAKVRARLAHAVEVMSDALAALARSLRNGETA